jgi:hypothetical protein
MSEAVLPNPRPWWQAGVCGALVPMLLGVTLLVGWSVVSSLETGEIEISPAILVTILVFTLSYCALIAFPTAFLLIGMMMLAERRTPKPLALWLLLSLIATAPIAAFVWLVSHMGDCFNDRCRAIGELQMSAPALIAFGFGLLGAAVARRVRHGVWL